jgi:hypothetical protein
MRMILEGAQSRTEGGGNGEARQIEVLGKVRGGYIGWKLHYHHSGGSLAVDCWPGSGDPPSGELWQLSGVSQAP